MANKKDLEAYLRKNSVRETKTEKAGSSDAVPDERSMRPAGKTVVAYGMRRIAMDASLALMFTAFFMIVAVYWMDHVFLMSMTEKIYGAILIFAVIVAVLTIAFTVRFIVYKRRAGQVPYKLQGWEEFVAARSTAYWEKILFVNVGVFVQLNDKASDLERRAVELFFKKWEERWGNTYSDLGFEGGTPGELRANGTGASGDFSRKQLSKLTYTMSWRFLSLARMLGSSLDHVSITSRGKERKFKFTAEKDDVYDRHSSWQSRHES